MANESIVYGIDGTRANAGEVDVAVVSTGATLTGDNDIEVRILKATFATSAGKFDTSTKQHMVDLLKSIVAKIEKDDNWPLGGYV